MKNMKAIGFCSLAAISTLFACTALAQDSYFYGGVGVGQSRAMVDDEAMSMKLRASGAMTNTFKADESDTTFKGFIGYQMNRNFGVEAGYFNLGKSSFTATTQPNGSYSSEQKIDGVNLDLVGTLPFSDKWSGLARIGAQYANVRSTGAVMLPSTSTSVCCASASSSSSSRGPPTATRGGASTSASRSSA